ncbi:MAG: competence/damage-inducible protein A [Rhodospirillales bacterium]|jgi:molybdenum cofactor synthesis domain-containing protein|nr:competence/damage-inducible protein A [Rhodospirillales bacterium]
MGQDRVYTACVIIIGNEVLSGRTRDANLQYLGERLNDLGIRLAEARVIRDDDEVIQRTVNECRAAYDYVITTGGIGPTHDDITSASIAKAFGVELRQDAEAVALLKRHYTDDEFNEARQKMTYVPKGARLVKNPISSAPGFQIDNVFVLAGVPMIMRAMFEELQDSLAGGRPMVSRTVAAHVTEGALAAGLGAAQDKYADVEMGSYPFYRKGRIGVSVVLRGADGGRVEEAAADIADLVRGLGAEPVDEADI